jgi:hypothetical protein
MFRPSTSGSAGGSIMDDVVELNVGGTIHHITRQTLLKVPGTLFSDVAAGKVKLPRDKQGGRRRVAGRVAGCAEGSSSTTTSCG